MRNNIFKNIKIGKPRRNAFDLGHEKKLSMNFSDLVPIYLQEVLPGDKFRVKTEQIIRFAPMIAPVMHRINVYIHYFFVPNRLLWDDWQKFITGGEDGTYTSPLPTWTINDSNKQYFGIGSLADYFGVPPVADGLTVTNTKAINALPFRAYGQIYNDYYRDQTLKSEIVIDKGLSATSYDCLFLRKRCWEKDYFTSALPWTQRGDDVNIPMDIVYQDQAKLKTDQGYPTAKGVINYDSSGGITSADPGFPSTIENVESIGATINDLRTSIRLQEWLEKNARAGSRYIEQIMAHFGVRTPDYRLQRSEYLGGGKTPIQISEVLANFGNDTIPQGNMAGHGIGIGNQSGFQRSFNEHGWILGIMSVLPVSNYTTGIPKQFLKESRFDFAFPEFAHLGEQPVLTEELWHDWEQANVNPVFGYQSRYCEYKHIPSTCHGEFRSSLDFWHLGRKFDSEPLLNNSFVECVVDEGRIFAVDDVGATAKIYCQLYNDVKAIRPLPVFGTPML